MNSVEPPAQLLALGSPSLSHAHSHAKKDVSVMMDSSSVATSVLNLVTVAAIIMINTTRMDRTSGKKRGVSTTVPVMVTLGKFRANPHHAALGSTARLIMGNMVAIHCHKESAMLLGIPIIEHSIGSCLTSKAPVSMCWHPSAMTPVVCRIFKWKQGTSNGWACQCPLLWRCLSWFMVTKCILKVLIQE